MRCLLVDDHPVVRIGLKAILGQVQPETEVLEAEDLTSSLVAVAESGPFDLVLMDLRMPGMGDLAGLEQMRAVHGTRPVAIITSVEDSALARRAFALGAAGYLIKSLPPRVLVQAVRLILAGGLYLPPILLDERPESAESPPIPHARIIKAPGAAQAGSTVFPGVGSVVGPAALAALSGPGETEEQNDLTPRQKQILRLMREGFSNRELADQLGVSEATVKGHITQLLRHLGVPSRAKAVHLSAHWPLDDRGG